MDIVIKPSWKDTIRRGFQSPASFGKEILETEMHEEERECLDLMAFAEMFALTTGNRWGKGEVITILSAWKAAYKPVAKQFKEKPLAILNTSISQDQANIVFDKFTETYLERPKFGWMIKDVKRSPFPHIKFKSGVTWWFRNASQDGKFLEGRSYFYANFDEADLQRNLKGFLEDILSPRLWDQGGCLSWTTTPRRGKKNAYKVWELIEKQRKAGNKKVNRFRGDARKNIFLSPIALERMGNLPKRLFNKNVLGLYEDSDGMISNEICDYAELIAEGLRDRPEPGAKYINVWDFARSTTFNVGITLELSNPLQLRSWERTQEDKGSRSKKYWDLIKKRVRERQTKWGGKTVIDATGLGDVLGSDLADIHPVLVKFSSNIRSAIIEEGVACLENGEIGLPLQGNTTHKGIEQVLNGEYWCLRDELTDFDIDGLEHIVWDFVCCLCMGAWYSKGFRPNKVKVKGEEIRPAMPARMKGINKYGTVRT